jgi:hypothetical protein
VVPVFYMLIAAEHKAAPVEEEAEEPAGLQPTLAEA